MEQKLNELNKKYSALTPLKRVEEIYRDFDKLLLTSSFGTTSVFLIHLFNQVNKEQEIHFINTGYHFTETLDFKEQLKEKFGISINEVRPERWISRFTTADKTWEKDPDWCCSLNKVEPFEKIKQEYDVWASGLMAFQNQHRKGLKIFEEKKGMIRFYPLLDITEQEMNEYFKKHDLPLHPLVEKGYSSIGCIHCTVPGKGREGRWPGKKKSECGLHI